MTARRTLCVLAVLACGAAAQAHRLDEYLHSTTIRIAPGRIALHVRLVPGVEMARQAWRAMDRDGDGELSPVEQQTYARQVLDDLAVSVDGRLLDLGIVNWSFPTQADNERGVGQVSLGLDAQCACGAGPHRLRVVARRRPLPSVYLVNTLVPADSAIRIDGQRRNADQTVYDLDFTRAE